MVEVLSFIRTRDGFLTAMHDVAPERDGVHRVAVFNPGSNARQVSRLRLVNPGDGAAAVTIRGIDDAGASPGGPVELSVPARGALMVSAADLEAGTAGRGALGDGFGKWELRIEADRPVQVMSLSGNAPGALDEPVDCSGSRGRNSSRAVVPFGVGPARTRGLRAAWSTAASDARECPSRRSTTLIGATTG